MTYNFSYPPEIIRRSAKMAETSQLGGYEWGPRWGSWNLYIRLYGGDGTKAQIKAAVMRRATTISNALEMDYPRATAPEVNAVFSEILSQSEAQTMAFLESVEPVAKLSRNGGLSETESWKRTALFPKAVFDSIRPIRCT